MNDLIGTKTDEFPVIPITDLIKESNILSKKRDFLIIGLLGCILIGEIICILLII